jgi:D-glycero-D-manno-heptose 1,7-bisphosphate phosphatase
LPGRTRGWNLCPEADRTDAQNRHRSGSEFLGKIERKKKIFLTDPVRLISCLVDLMKSAVIFERDGVLNEVHYSGRQQVVPAHFEDFKIHPAVVQPLRELKEAGYLLIATTNQPGISLGSVSRREVDRMHLRLQEQLRLDGVLLCPHTAEDDCPCRKPKAGMLTEAAFRWHLDLDRCFVVSDKWQDAQAAHISRCTSIMLRSPWVGSGHHDFVVADVPAAVAKILQLQPCGRLPQAAMTA